MVLMFGINLAYIHEQSLFKCSKLLFEDIKMCNLMERILMKEDSEYIYVEGALKIVVKNSTPNFMLIG